MWAVLHIYEEEDINSLDRVIKIEDVVFTTNDREGAFQYIEKWHAGQVYDRHHFSGEDMRCGSLWVKWIPDPLEKIPFEESPVKVNEKAVPMYVPEWGGGGEED